MASLHHSAGPCNNPRLPTFPMTTMHGDSFVSDTSSAPRDSDVRQTCWSPRAAPRMTATCMCMRRVKALDPSCFLNILIAIRTQHVKKPVYPLPSEVLHHSMPSRVLSQDRWTCVWSVCYYGWFAVPATGQPTNVRRMGKKKK